MIVNFEMRISSMVGEENLENEIAHQIGSSNLKVHLTLEFGPHVSQPMTLVKYLPSYIILLLHKPSGLPRAAHLHFKNPNVQLIQPFFWWRTQLEPSWSLNLYFGNSVGNKRKFTLSTPSSLAL